MKYYRVLQNTFLWEKGAIITNDPKIGTDSGYRAIDPIWNVTEDQTEYITSKIVEDKTNEAFFQRVYPVNLLTKTVYKLKEEAKEMLSKNHE